MKLFVKDFTGSLETEKKKSSRMNFQSLPSALHRKFVKK